MSAPDDFDDHFEPFGWTNTAGDEPGLGINASFSNFTDEELAFDPNALASSQGLTQSILDPWTPYTILALGSNGFVSGASGQGSSSPSCGMTDGGGLFVNSTPLVGTFASSVPSS